MSYEDFHKYVKHLTITTINGKQYELFAVSPYKEQIIRIQKDVGKKLETIIKAYKLPNEELLWVLYTRHKKVIKRKK